MTLYTELDTLKVRPLKWDWMYPYEADTEMGAYWIFKDKFRHTFWVALQPDMDIDEIRIAEEIETLEQAKEIAQTDYENRGAKKTIPVKVYLPLDPLLPHQTTIDDRFAEGWNACLALIQHRIDEAVRKYEQQLANRG